jgi:hypothetical protein
MAKEAGEIVRYEPAPEPLPVAIAIGFLAILDAVFVILFLWGSFIAFPRWNSPADQQVLAFWLANSFFVTALILVLYRRYFLPDLLVVKKRRKKFEDF